MLLTCIVSYILICGCDLYLYPYGVGVSDFSDDNKL